MRTLAAIGLSLVLLGAGCEAYQITDTRTGNVFYTTTITEVEEGAVEFKDMRTGSKVTVEKPEVETITRTQAQQAMFADEKKRSRAASVAGVR